MTTWLLKSEPDVYSYDDLVRDRRTEWDGVSNMRGFSGRFWEGYRRGV